MSNNNKLFKRLNKLSISDDDDDIWNQWKLQHCFHTDNDSLSDVIENWCTHSYNLSNQFTTCLCSKYPIKNLNLMNNPTTKQRCIIGSCCIKKFGNDSIKTELRVQTGIKLGKRYCDVCKRKLPDDLEKWKTCHKSCYFQRLQDIKQAKYKDSLLFQVSD